jgi:5S rRNA maturation endonuclease (ribonuclease M5)
MRQIQLCMFRFLSVLIFVLSFSNLSAQEVAFLNKYKVPIQDVNAYEPVYFKITSQEQGKSVAKTFCMDSTLIHEKHTIKSVGDKELVLYDADYYGNGSLRSLKESVDEKKVFIQEYYENEKVKSKRLLLGEEVLEESYFDEEGSPRSKIEEEHPEPFGGMEGWNKYLVKNLKYPKEARKKGIGGIAYLYFKIDEEGVMQDVAITNPESISPLLAEEAIRVMTSYPYVWTPAKVDGKPVNVEMRFPLRFVSP